MMEEIVYFSYNSPAYTFPKEFTNNFYISDFRAQHDFSYTYTSNFSIKYTLEGVETYHVNGAAVKITKGQTLFINEDSMVGTGHVDGMGISLFIENKILFDIERSLKKEVLDSCEIDGSGFFPLFEDKEISTAYHLKRELNKIYGRFMLEGPIWLSSEDYYDIAEAFYRDYSLLNKQLANLNSIQDIRNRKDVFFRLNQMYDYLISDLSRSPSLQELSRVAQISPFYLNRLFKEVYGLPPIKYLIRKKMQKACELLTTQKSLPITEVAYQLGYDTVGSFSKQFKVIVGESPSTYRFK